MGINQVEGFRLFRFETFVTKFHTPADLERCVYLCDNLLVLVVRQGQFRLCTEQYRSHFCAFVKRFMDMPLHGVYVLKPNDGEVRLLTDVGVGLQPRWGCNVQVIGFVAAAEIVLDNVFPSTHSHNLLHPTKRRLGSGPGILSLLAAIQQMKKETLWVSFFFGMSWNLGGISRTRFSVATLSDKSPGGLPARPRAREHQREVMIEYGHQHGARQFGLQPGGPAWEGELREILKQHPDAGPWLARLVKKSLRQGSEIVIIFTAPEGFRLHFITVAGRLPQEADIDLMAFSFMAKVVVEQTGKTLRDEHKIVVAVPPRQLDTVLEGMDLDKAPLWKRNPIPHWTADIKTDA